MSRSNTRHIESSKKMGLGDISDSESDSDISQSESESSLQENTMVQCLLHCFAFKQDLIDADLSKADLTDREKLLVDAIKESRSLIEIREMLNQNPEMFDNITKKLFPESYENKCPNCN